MAIYIDDNIDMRRVAAHLGNDSGLLPRDYSNVPFGAMPYTKPFAAEVPIIPESEWPDRIKAMQGRQIRYHYTGTPAEDYQNGLSYCWVFSLSQAIKGVRDVAGLPHIDLLAESLGYDVGWRNAGNYCGSAIAAAAKTGLCDRSFSPKRYNLDPSTWKDGWEEEAKNHRVLEWWELGAVNMRQEVCTALLLGYGVYCGLNWARHAVWFDELILENGKYLIHTPNTHGEGRDWILSGSKMVPDEAYVVRSTTFSQA